MPMFNTLEVKKLFGLKKFDLLDLRCSLIILYEQHKKNIIIAKSSSRAPWESYFLFWKKLESHVNVGFFSKEKNILIWE